MRKLMYVLLMCSAAVSAAPSVKDVKQIYNRLLAANPEAKRLKLVVDKCVNKWGEEISNAYNNDGKSILVCTAYLRNLKNTDELAFTLGHELAHTKWKTEQHADYTGALYAQKAGYNYCTGAKMFKRFGKGDMPVHPPGKDRWKAMRCK